MTEFFDLTGGSCKPDQVEVIWRYPKRTIFEEFGVGMSPPMKERAIRKACFDHPQEFNKFIEDEEGFNIVDLDDLLIRKDSRDIVPIDKEIISEDFLKKLMGRGWI